MRSVYEGAIQQLVDLVREFENTSCPHFLFVPQSYIECSTKLFIVGQQTYRWGHPEKFNISEGLSETIQEYKNFNLGENYTRSPFWQACLKIQKLINPSSPSRAFIWSNLVKIDQGGNRPNKELEHAVSLLNLLQSELRITQPDAIVFFTGPYYDDRLVSSFPQMQIMPESAFLAKLRDPTLPELSFRTYHPNYLRRSRNWGVLDEISNEILSARTVSNGDHNDAPLIER